MISVSYEGITATNKGIKKAPFHGQDILHREPSITELHQFFKLARVDFLVLACQKQCGDAHQLQTMLGDILPGQEPIQVVDSQE